MGPSFPFYSNDVHSAVYVFDALLDATKFTENMFSMSDDVMWFDVCDDLPLTPLLTVSRLLGGHMGESELGADVTLIIIC